MSQQFNVKNSDGTFTSDGNNDSPTLPPVRSPNTPIIRPFNPYLDRNPSIPEWVNHLPPTVSTEDHMRLQDLFLQRAEYQRQLYESAHLNAGQIVFDIGAALGGEEGIGAGEEIHKLQLNIGSTERQIQQVIDRNNLQSYAAQFQPAGMGNSFIRDGQYWSNDGGKTWRLVGNKFNLFGESSFTGMGLLGVLLTLIAWIASMLASVTQSTCDVSPSELLPPSVTSSALTPNNQDAAADASLSNSNYEVSQSDSTIEDCIEDKKKPSAGRRAKGRSGNHGRSRVGSGSDEPEVIWHDGVP